MKYLFSDLSYTFKKSPNDITVHEGEITRLSCLIDSIPYPPNITWQYNGRFLLSDRNNTKYGSIYYLFIKSINTFDLIIKQLHRSEVLLIFGHKK